MRHSRKSQTEDFKTYTIFYEFLQPINLSIDTLLL